MAARAAPCVERLEKAMRVNVAKRPGLGAIASDGSVEAFAETVYASGEQKQTENSHAQHLGPQHTEACALQEYAAHHDQVVTQRISVGQPLQDSRHGADRKAETRQDRSRQDHKERDDQGLLLSG